MLEELTVNGSGFNQKSYIYLIFVCFITLLCYAIRSIAIV